MDRRSFLKILGVVVTPLPALVPWALPRGTAIRFLHEGEVVADDYPVQNFTVPSTMKACLDYTHAPSGFFASAWTKSASSPMRSWFSTGPSKS